MARRRPGFKSLLLTLDDYTHGQLRARSNQMDIPVTAVIRCAVVSYLAVEPGPLEDRAMAERRLRLERAAATAGNQPVAVAARWLEAELAAGPVESGELYDRAEAAGIKQGSIFRAKRRLRIQPRREGYGGAGRWYWSLPAVLEQDVGTGVALPTAPDPAELPEL